MMPWCSHWNNGRCVWPGKVAFCEHIIQLRRLWYSYIYSDSSSFIITNHCWNYSHPLALEHHWQHWQQHLTSLVSLHRQAYMQAWGLWTGCIKWPPYMTHTMTRGCKKGCNKNCSSKRRKIPCYVDDCQRYLSKGCCVQHLETLMTWALGDRAWWVTAQCSGHV